MLAKKSVMHLDLPRYYNHRMQYTLNQMIVEPSRPHCMPFCTSGKTITGTLWDSHALEENGSVPEVLKTNIQRETRFKSRLLADKTT